MSLRRCIKVLWVVALLLTSEGCALFDTRSEPQYTTEQLRDMGEKLMAANALGQALKLLTEAESRAPRDPVIQYDLGRGYELRGMEAQALEHYRKAVDLKPDYAEAHNALGAFYARRGDTDSAELHFMRALGNPFFSSPHIVYYNLGLLYEKRGESQRALEQYQQAVRLQPYYGLAHYHIGQMLENLKRADAAREAYGKAIECSRDLVEAHFRYGVMSYMAGEMENAIYSLSRVVKLAPHTTMASDARKYLDRLQGAMGSGASRSSNLLPSERISHLEVISNRDLQSQGTASAATPSSLPAGSTGVQEYSASIGEQKISSTQTASPSTGSKLQPEAPSPPPPGTQWTYIVQVGSFLDKDNAEDLKQRLKTKGYNVLVKPLQHQVLGQVYIVQFNPVTDEAKASTLLAQVEGDEKVKPIIIKVPASY